MRINQLLGKQFTQIDPWDPHVVSVFGYRPQ